MLGKKLHTDQTPPEVVDVSSDDAEPDGRRVMDPSETSVVEEAAFRRLSDDLDRLMNVWGELRDMWTWL